MFYRILIYVPSATETCRFYDQAWFPSSDLRGKIEALWSKVFAHYRYTYLYARMFTHKNTSHPCLAVYFYAVNFSGY